MSTPWRIIIRQTGGPEVLETEALGPLEPRPDELLIRHEAIGLNFIDTYFRNGLYPARLPSGLGSEAAGIVEEAGSEVDGFQAGDRVAYFSHVPGAYATHRTMRASRVIRLPETIRPDVAAASLLKGCTAEALIERCAQVQAGDTVLVHAAAGGVGSILIPWLKAVGATVIAHAGNSVKAERATALGADHAFSCQLDELAGHVRSVTGDAGVRVVFDGVGAASWKASLGSVARRGLLISYGNASGPVPPIPLSDLMQAGSIFLTRPGVFDYTRSEEELRASAARLFEMIGAGTVTIDIGARFPLAEAAEAHRALESRATTGSTVLIP